MKLYYCPLRVQLPSHWNVSSVYSTYWYAAPSMAVTLCYDFHEVAMVGLASCLTYQTSGVFILKFQLKINSFV